MNKGVSCLCLTYGRPALLEEAIESFIRQQWDGPKELIVVNDHPDQKLVYRHKKVRIYNLKRRLPTLGQKRNLSVALALYNHLLIWDDDDIHLPWRIEETMKAMADSQYFKCGPIWVSEKGELYKHTPKEEVWFHGTSGYSRNLYEAIGGYKRINAGEDTDFEIRLKSNKRTNKFWRVSQLPIERIYYIYRWSHGHYHTTGCMDLRKIQPEVKRGTYKLEPHWKVDYCKEVEQQIKRMLEQQA
jgi:glycosyltransferase involved in cell wall biosynthesis